MQLNNLPKVVVRPKKRVGRGIGSGKGKTSARGSKGQKARGTVPAGFTGGGLPLYKKLPFKRGLGNTKVSVKTMSINLNELNKLKAKSVVNLTTLIENKIITEKESRKGVKILADGELKIALTVEIPVSKKAKELIEKVGGKVA